MSKIKKEQPWDELIGRRIKVLREARGMSQAALANAVNAPGRRFLQQTVAKVELGERALKLEEAYAIAGALGVDVGDLVAEGGSPAALRAQTLQAAERVQRAGYELLKMITAYDDALDDAETANSALYRSLEGRPRDEQDFHIRNLGVAYMGMFEQIIPKIEQLNERVAMADGSWSRAVDATHRDKLPPFWPDGKLRARTEND